MKIEVICDSCSFPDEEMIKMEADEQLFINPTTKTQFQKYRCRECDAEITVLVTLELKEISK